MLLFYFCVFFVVVLLISPHSLSSLQHRDLASRNVLVDKYLSCHVGGFGLALSMTENTSNGVYGDDDDDDGLYSAVGSPGNSQDLNKAAVRWASIEVNAVEYRVLWRESGHCVCNNNNIIIIIIIIIMFFTLAVLCLD